MIVNYSDILFILYVLKVKSIYGLNAKNFKLISLRPYMIKLKNASPN